MADPGTHRRIGQAAVEVALGSLVRTRLKTQSDSMLRTFLGFKAIHRYGVHADVDTPAIKSVVDELFTLLPTPEGVPEKRYSGTIALRGSQGRPVWLRNDAYRGSVLDYAGPSSPGRFMFQGEDWRNPMLGDAVNRVTETLGGTAYAWPPRDALAAIALRNQRSIPPLDGRNSWRSLVNGSACPPKSGRRSHLRRL